MEYGFTVDPRDHNRPFCVVCKKTFSTTYMTAERLSNHQKTEHKETIGKPVKYFMLLLHKWTESEEGRKAVASVKVDPGEPLKQEPVEVVDISDTPEQDDD